MTEQLAEAPTLLGPAAPARPAAPANDTLIANPASLLDLMYDGFYLLFLLKNRHAPKSCDEFRGRLHESLVEFERGARRLEATPEAIHQAKYAFCALVDETILNSQFQVREAWLTRPMQLEYFGDQLAGEHFFERLETLRHHGAPSLQVLEVFHMCLLLGFQGKYLLEGSEKLNYLTARVGDEIAHLRGRRRAFAPHALLPDRVAHPLRRELPLWAGSVILAACGLLAYVGLRALLAHETEQQLDGYTHLVQLAPPMAHVTISLP